MNLEFLTAIGLLVATVVLIYQLEKRKRRIQNENRCMRNTALYLEMQSRGQQ